MELLESNATTPYFATDNFIIFSISGGAGKNVLATAVVKAIKAKHPEMNIVVLTAWKDVWMYNPNVYRTYNFQNTPYFYENYIKGKNVKIFSLEPYPPESYILKKEHLICHLVQYVRNQIQWRVTRIIFQQARSGVCAKHYRKE